MIPGNPVWVRVAAISSVFFINVIAMANENSRRPPWTTSRIQGSPESPPRYRIAPVFPQIRFDHPTSIEEISGLHRLLVTEMGGKIFTIDKRATVPKAEPLLDLRELLPAELANQSVSLFDAELHPRFRENRSLFVCYVHPGKGGHTRVSRFNLTDQVPPRVVRSSERIVITWPTGGHNGGCLEFGKDGYLYISTGDGSGPNPPDGLTTGQDVSDLLGAVLRIDVDRKLGDRNYTIPSDNPFVGINNTRPEIWAYGLRNPWKIGVDLQTGNVFAADNGWESWEMIHLIDRGRNCGWPIMEGRASLRTEVKPGPTPISPPIKDHPHTEANSVIGGPVYRGSKLPELAGSFIYGDYITGTIWAIRVNADDSYTHTTLVDTDQRIVSFTQGSQGELYVLDYDFTGQVYELLPSGLEDTSANFPRRLSETGLFTALETLQPASGVIPYDVRVDRWLDGAIAQRWVAIPGDGQIRLATGKNQAEYPEGTVFVKHLSLPQGESHEPSHLETQILHYENGQWHPFSYLWDERGSDAQLVESIGVNRSIRVADKTAQGGYVERTWHVSATNECKLCHNPGSRFVLGFTPSQLGLSTRSPNDQIAFLDAQQVLANATTVSNTDRSSLVDPFEVSENLNDRARSYLHANCGICHHAGGSAIVSFYLTRNLTFDQLNTNKGTGIGTFGMRNAKIIVPGDPYRSVLMYRMSKLGYARMPYIGSHVIDSEGVELIEQWIRSLPHVTSVNDSGPVLASSKEAKALQLLAREELTSRAERDSAIRELVQSTEGALALVARMHRGAMTQQDLQAAVAMGRAVSTSDIRGLFENFVPESERRATLGSQIDPATILGKTGNHARGKLIFFSDAARCRACHEINDANKSLGPSIVEINKKYPRQSELLQHVLQPSLKIDEQFVGYTIVTHGGRVITGLLVDKSDREVVIKTVERHVVRIAANDIDEMKKSTKSLMPDFLLSDLTAQEAADLLRYIQSHGADAKP